jgi:hypothetical protein
MFKNSSNKLPSIYNISLNIENDEKENENKNNDLCECGVCLNNNIELKDFIKFRITDRALLELGMATNTKQNMFM